jgi:hypothetical protein
MFQQLFQNETTKGQNMAQAIEIIGGGYRNRTGLLGFAIRCIACLPTRLSAALISHACARRQVQSGKN